MFIVHCKGSFDKGHGRVRLWDFEPYFYDELFTAGLVIIFYKSMNTNYTVKRTVHLGLFVRTRCTIILRAEYLLNEEDNDYSFHLTEYVKLYLSLYITLI